MQSLGTEFAWVFRLLFYSFKLINIIKKKKKKNNDPERRLERVN